MAQDVGRDRLHVVGRDVVAAAQEGMGARRLRQRDGGARRRAELDERRELGESRVRRRARRVHEVDDVVDDALVEAQAGDGVPRGEDRLRRGHVLHRDGVTRPAMRRMISFSSSRDG